MLYSRRELIHIHMMSKFPVKPLLWNPASSTVKSTYWVSLTGQACGYDIAPVLYMRISVNHNPLGCKQPPGLDMSTSHSLRRTCFGQYQASSAALE